jgi:hypothetical protein
MDLKKLIVCDNRNLQPNVFDAIINKINIYENNEFVKRF